jgi:hypothetical protein
LASKETPTGVVLSAGSVVVVLASAVPLGFAWTILVVAFALLMALVVAVVPWLVWFVWLVWFLRFVRLRLLGVAPSWTTTTGVVPTSVVPIAVVVSPAVIGRF